MGLIGLPRRLGGKESTCQCWRHGLGSWVRKILWRRKWHPTPIFWKIPRTEEPGRLQPMRSQTVRHDVAMSTNGACAFTLLSPQWKVFPQGSCYPQPGTQLRWIFVEKNCSTCAQTYDVEPKFSSWPVDSGENEKLIATSHWDSVVGCTAAELADMGNLILGCDCIKNVKYMLLV